MANLGGVEGFAGGFPNKPKEIRRRGKRKFKQKAEDAFISGAGKVEGVGGRSTSHWLSDLRRAAFTWREMFRGS